MIISHNFGLGLEGYVRSGQANDFPVFDSCPNCGCFGPGNVRRHGFYDRLAVDTLLFPLHHFSTFRCAACSVTISILPEFLLPYFQHTLCTIFGRVQALLERKKVARSRQLGGFISDGKLILMRITLLPIRIHSTVWMTGRPSIKRRKIP